MEQIEKEERIHFSTRDSAAPTRQTEIGCAYISNQCRSSCIKKKRKKNFLSSTQIFLPTSRTAIRNRREREKAIWSVEGRNAKKSGTRESSEMLVLRDTTGGRYRARVTVRMRSKEHVCSYL